MIVTAPVQASKPAAVIAPPATIRRAAIGHEPTVLDAIQQEAINIAIWQRTLSTSLQRAVQALLAAHPDFQTEMTVTPENASACVGTALGTAEYTALSEEIAELVERFYGALQLHQTKLRLTTLDKVMCPKFHADRVPCRLLTTYRGIATEWLPHHLINHAQLGLATAGQTDFQAGLFQSPNDIRQLRCGDVALLKGELWAGNKNAGLVHRSPAISAGETRLLLRLDVIR